VLCTDAVLLPLNQGYLRHNTLTDIITFQFHDKGEPLAGEIYISIDRVRENAIKFKVSAQEELHRVMVHGLLHLMGYTDKRASDKGRMRKKEDTYLSLWK
jgi:rRNA maturation RNase YbeY